MPETEGPAAAGSPPGQPRTAGRSWPRRVARGLLILFLFSLVPVLAGLVLLHLPVGRAAVKAFVEEAVGRSVDGRVRLGTLDYSLLRGRIDLTALDLRGEGFSVQVHEAHLLYRPREGARLALVRPVVVLRDTGRPKPKETAGGIAARPWTLLGRFAQVELRDGRVELQDRQAAPYLVVAGLDATMRPVGGRPEASLSLREGTIALGSASRLGPMRGEGRLAVQNGELRVERLRLSGVESSLEATATLARLSPNEGSLALAAVLDAALVHELSPGTRELSGRVEASAGVRLAGDDVGGTLELVTTTSLA